MRRAVAETRKGGVRTKSTRRGKKEKEGTTHPFPNRKSSSEPKKPRESVTEDDAGLEGRVGEETREKSDEGREVGRKSSKFVGLSCVGCSEGFGEEDGESFESLDEIEGDLERRGERKRESVKVRRRTGETKRRKTYLASRVPIRHPDVPQRLEKLSDELVVVSENSFGKKVSDDDRSSEIVELCVEEVKVPSVRVVSVVGGVGLEERGTKRMQKSQKSGREGGRQEKRRLTFASAIHSAGTRSFSTTNFSFSSSFPTFRKRSSLIEFSRLNITGGRKKGVSHQKRNGRSNYRKKTHDSGSSRWSNTNVACSQRPNCSNWDA